MNYPIRTFQQLRPPPIGFRKQAGLSQADVAELLGVTQQSYAKIEANPAVTLVSSGCSLSCACWEVAGQGADNGIVGAVSPTPIEPAPVRITPPSKPAEDW